MDSSIHPAMHPAEQLYWMLQWSIQVLCIVLQKESKDGEVGGGRGRKKQRGNVQMVGVGGVAKYRDSIDWKAGYGVGEKERMMHLAQHAFFLVFCLEKRRYIRLKYMNKSIHTYVNAHMSLYRHMFL